jgi:hypothetical protein
VIVIKTYIVHQQRYWPSDSNKNIDSPPAEVLAQCLDKNIDGPPAEVLAQ